MTSVKRFSLLMLCLNLMACVTVNIYFPEAAAQKAADRIIQDIYGQKAGKGEKEQAPPASNKSSSLDSANPFAAILNLLVPQAEAAQPNFDISTPGIERLRASMRARQQQLAPFYASGAIGLTSNGLITIRDPKAIQLKDRNRVNQLVAAENRDRNALYTEIPKANGHPGWEADIRATFARRWIANAPAGWWYQDSGGNWHRK